ncbi:MAG: trypsin-like peptidase domain-containing protein, partial [Acidobacteriota bacterium]
MFQSPNCPSFRTALTAGIIVSLAVCGGAAAQDAGVFGERVPGAYDGELKAFEAHALSQELLAAEDLHKGRPVGFEIELDQAEAERLANAPTSSGRLLVGLTKKVGAAVAFTGRERFAKAARAHANGLLRVSSDGFFWSTTVHAKGATATRLHFTEVALPDGVELFIYSTAGEAFGPYTGKGVLGTGDFWSHTVIGPEVRIQLRFAGEQVARVLAATRLQLAEVVYQGPKYLPAQFLRPELFSEESGFGTKAFCSFNASCVQNASCSSLPGSVQSARDAVAHYAFVSGGSSFICSGGLVNDTDNSTFIPYFLTANHCVNTAAEVGSIEAFFQFSTPCGGACFNPRGSVPRVLGATLLAGSSATDFTLTRLNGNAPGGSFLLGWSPTAVAFSNNTQLNRISHPRGAPQAFSQQRVTTSGVSCTTLPRGNFIYSKDTFGATEGGSSGSPILNTSGQIVGQLFGACGTNLGNVCDAVNNSTVDGAFASYFSQVEPFLDPSSGPDPNSCEDQCGGQAPGGCWC